jgi:hypothetical protein
VGQVSGTSERNKYPQQVSAIIAAILAIVGQL